MYIWKSILLLKCDFVAFLHSDLFFFSGFTGEDGLYSLAAVAGFIRMETHLCAAYTHRQD